MADERFLGAAIFGIDHNQLNESNLNHAINYGALVIALIEKGVLTQKEYDRAHARATHIMEQAFAKNRDDAEKEIDEKHPGLRNFFDKMFDSD